MTKVINKSQEEVEQSYQENSYQETPEKLVASGDFTVTWNGVDITPECGDATFLKVTERKPKCCPHNDCGWCYYRGDGNSNDINGACNNAETCEVNNED